MLRPTYLPAALLCVCLLGTAQAQEGPARLELIELRDLELTDALQVVSLQTGLNIVSSANAAKTRVTLTLRNVTPLAALEALCQTHDLWFRRDEETGIYRISTAGEYQRDIQSFRAAEIEVFTLLYPNARDVSQAIRDLFGQRVVLGQAGLVDQSIQDLQERFQRFDLIDGRSQGFGQLGGNNAVGNTQQNQNQQQNRLGNRGNNNQNNSSLLRSLTQGNQSRDEDVDADQRQVGGLRGEQIQELESGNDSALVGRLARQTSIYVSVNARTNQLFVRSGDTEAVEQIRGLVRSMDRPTPLVLLEVKVMSVLLDDDFNSVFDLQFNDPGSRTGGEFTTGTVAQQPADLVPTSNTLARRAADFGLAGTGLNPEQLVFQYVGKYLRARMQLLAGENRITTLATPVLLTANNEVSRLFAGEERPINRSFQGGQTVVGAGGNVVNPATTQIEFRPVGTTLLITANINADRTVSLLILQETSSINIDGASVLVPAGTGFIRQNVDVVQSRSVSGTVVAKDGQMIAIGGLIEEELRDTRSGIPWLSEIPILGFFFRRQELERVRRELVITLTPHVLTTPQEAEDASRRLIRENSIHPKRNDPRGSLESFRPEDVLRAPEKGWELFQMFDVHSGVDYDDE